MPYIEDRGKGENRTLTYLVVILCYTPHLGRGRHTRLHLWSLWCFRVWYEMIETLPGAWKTHKHKKFVYNLEELALVLFSDAPPKEGWTYTVCFKGINHTQELLGVGLWGLTHVQAHGLACSWADLAHRGVVMGWKVALWNLRWRPRLSLSQSSERKVNGQQSGNRTSMLTALWAVLRDNGGLS